MLIDLGIKVHARSVLLQGLLIQSPQRWPQHLSTAFIDHHSRWLDDLLKNGLSPLVGALRYFRSSIAIEAVLVGVVSYHQLSQILDAWTHAEFLPSVSPFSWSWNNAFDLDPRRWPKT